MDMTRSTLRVAALLAVIAAASAAVGTTRADAVGPVGGTLDVEIAVDSTGTMGPLIAPTSPARSGRCWKGRR